MTMKTGNLLADEPAEAPALESVPLPASGHWHRWIERRPIQMMLFATVMILIGGLEKIFQLLLLLSLIRRLNYKVVIFISAKVVTPVTLKWCVLSDMKQNVTVNMQKQGSLFMIILSNGDQNVQVQIYYA